MNLHEYQAKALFAQYGVMVPNNTVVNNLEEAESALDSITTLPWVIKAQVHAGGRGKSGGVKLTSDRAEALEIINNMLGSRLVTYQTTAEGQPVSQVLIEEPSRIKRELYLGAVLDRASRRVTFMASTEGGVEIEKVAAETPEKILKAAIDPLVGLQSYQVRDLAFALGLEGDQIKQFGKIIGGLATIFEEKDLSLLEINPLVDRKSVV